MEFFNLIKEILEIFFATVLPKLTAEAFVKIWESDTATLVALAREYIAVLFG